jgi:hypothetical protein
MPLIEFHITADTEAEAIEGIEILARRFGVIASPVAIGKTETGKVTGEATGDEPPKKRGRKPKDAAAAATALTEEEPAAAEEEGDSFDPFDPEEEEEETEGLDLEKLKSDTIARLQKLAGSKEGLDTLSAITSKYNTKKERKFKFASLDSTVFTKIAADLDTLKV